MTSPTKENKKGIADKSIKGVTNWQTLFIIRGESIL